MERGCERQEKKCWSALIWVSYHYLLSFFKAFLLTVLIEFLVLYLFARKKASKAFAAVLLVNCLSLPVVWFVIPLIANSYLTYVFLAELFAVLSEAALLRILLQFSYKRAMAVSMTMNIASFLAGLTFPFLVAS